jgi:spore germination protein GerM
MIMRKIFDQYLKTRSPDLFKKLTTEEQRQADRLAKVKKAVQVEQKKPQPEPTPKPTPKPTPEPKKDQVEPEPKKHQDRPQGKKGGVA